MLRWIGLGVLGVVVVFGLVLALAGFSAGGERDLARTFMGHLGDRNFDAALAMMHPDLASQFPGDTLARGVGDLAVYTDISFSGFETSSERGTTVSGTATTANGCESPVTFSFVSDQLVAFNIETLCRAQ
ncbi:MAG: hypothetical protein AAF914_02420 [Pseudomonadota bacterium]